MDKKLFPGGEVVMARQQKRREHASDKAKRRVENARKKAVKREFLDKIGPATRLLIARRGFAAFAAAMLMQVGIGSAYWALVDMDKPYTDSIKNAYDITNLVDGKKWLDCEGNGMKEVFDTLVATVLLIGAVAAACKMVAYDRQVAKRTVRDVDGEIENDKWYKSDLSNDLYNIVNRHAFSSNLYSFESCFWKVHPVSRSIVKHMAELNPELFDNLLSGKTYMPSRDYAIAVVKGHLKSHPDDYKKLLAAYEYETLPKSLIQKYAAKSR